MSIRDIDYALMSQLIYFDWNKLNNIGTKNLKDIMGFSEYWNLIKTDWYNNPENIPSNETTSNGERGKLPERTYLGDDRRLYMVYVTDINAREGNFKFDNWEFLYSADSKKICKEMFGEETEKDSGFYAGAFKNGNTILILYRGTDIDESNDWMTNLKIYVDKNLTVQNFEAILFYEYIKKNYCKNGEKIEIVGYSLAGALAQYVAFYTNYEVKTVTWNALGAKNILLCHKEKTLLGDKYLENIEKIKDKEIKEKIKDFYYNISLDELIERRDNPKNIKNYSFKYDAVAGVLNQRDNSIGENIIVDEKTESPLLVSKGAKFHSINNFLIFMDDNGNICQKMRDDFRENFLKTIFLKKLGYGGNTIKSYLSPIERKDKEHIFYKIEEKKKDEFLRVNIENLFRFKVTSKTILNNNMFGSFFKEEWDKINKGEDWTKSKNNYVSVTESYIVIGKYNNIEELGEIQGLKTLVIYIEKDKKEEERKIIKSIQNNNSPKLIRNNEGSMYKSRFNGEGEYC